MDHSHQQQHLQHNQQQHHKQFTDLKLNIINRYATLEIGNAKVRGILTIGRRHLPNHQTFPK